MRCTVFVTLLSVAILAPPAVAETIYLEGGDTLEGEILVIGDESVTLALKGLEGSRIEIRKSQISPYGLYMIRSRRIDADSPGQHEALGDWAADQGLCEIAREEYAAAADLHTEGPPDSLARKLRSVRTACAREKLARASRLVGAKQFGRAEAILLEARKLAPGTELSEKIQKQLSEVQQSLAKKKAESEKERRDRQLDVIDAWLESVAELGRRADGLRKLAFLEADDLVEAEDDLLSAVKSLRKARRIVERVKKMSGAEGRAAAISEARSKVLSRMGEIYVDLGHHYVLRGSLIRATRYAGLALAIDPNDPRALRLRETISIAAEADDLRRRSSIR